MPEPAVIGDHYYLPPRGETPAIIWPMSMGPKPPPIDPARCGGRWENHVRTYSPPAPRGTLPAMHTPPTDEQLFHRYRHHAPTGDQGERYAAVRGQILDTAKRLRDLTPCCPEQTRAFNALDEAMFLANAAIARADGSGLRPVTGTPPAPIPLFSPEQIAAVCHEANRALCLQTGDTTQPGWYEAPGWQRESAVSGVRFHLENPDAGPEASHNHWLREKVNAGWRHGPIKDPEIKRHPCIMPFEGLPPEQQAKDRLFKAIVDALRHLAIPLAAE